MITMDLFLNCLGKKIGDLFVSVYSKCNPVQKNPVKSRTKLFYQKALTSKGFIKSLT